MANNKASKLRERIESMRPEDIRAELDKAIMEILELELRNAGIMVKVLTASKNHAELFFPTLKLIAVIKKIQDGSYSVEYKNIFEPKVQEAIATTIEVLENPFSPRVK